MWGGHCQSRWANSHPFVPISSNIFLAVLLILATAVDFSGALRLGLSLSTPDKIRMERLRRCASFGRELWQVAFYLDTPGQVWGTGFGDEVSFYQESCQYHTWYLGLICTSKWCNNVRRTLLILSTSYFSYWHQGSGEFEWSRNQIQRTPFPWKYRSIHWIHWGGKQRIIFWHRMWFHEWLICSLPSRR